MSMMLDGLSDPAAINELLAGANVPPGSRATILEAVVAARGDGLVVLAGTDSFRDVQIGPEGGAVAVTVGSESVAVAMERRLAARTATEHEFCRLDDPGAPDRSARLVIESWALQQHSIVVGRLLRAALVQAVAAPEPVAPTRAARPSRAAGATRTAAASRTPRTRKVAEPALPPAPKPPVCPVHFVQLVNGSCDYCDY